LVDRTGIAFDETNETRMGRVIVVTIIGSTRSLNNGPSSWSTNEVMGWFSFVPSIWNFGSAANQIGEEAVTEESRTLEAKKPFR
jgi:hypothetical protein